MTYIHARILGWRTNYDLRHNKIIIILYYRFKILNVQEKNFKF